jgi:hypothetical protein
MGVPQIVFPKIQNASNKRFQMIKNTQSYSSENPRAGTPCKSWGYENPRGILPGFRPLRRESVVPNHCVSRHFWGVRGLRMEPHVLSSKSGVANLPCVLNVFYMFSFLLRLNGSISLVRTRLCKSEARFEDQSTKESACF